tara:strand:- start:240 stop:755 length:516 start_codon:yes stop_codon:yes gene_type:complete
MKKSDKNYKYRDILTATDCAIVESENLLYSSSMKTQKNKTFNVCYLREYMDPEHQGDFFYAYETIYRNVPEKYRSKFNDKNIKMKILKFCDWNYKDMATNHTNVTKVELIDQDQYYTSYYDVFGETCDNEQDKKRMFNDYGQCYDRQSLRKDFNHALTKSKVLHYNDKTIN